ncbi:MAG: hypothetical protein ACXACF_11515 [Candidatus Hermodarchaeia archaeon]|jgi:hypothetical protein
MSKDTILINRAPVLTLWAAVVAERLGFAWEEALSLGKAVRPEKVKEARERKRGEEFWVQLCGRSVPAKNTAEGVRAVTGTTPVGPQSVQRYLSQKFGEGLELVRNTMKELATAFEPQDLAGQAFSLYEMFRPEIPRGRKGWGAKGVLDLDLIRSLAPGS